MKEKALNKINKKQIIMQFIHGRVLFFASLQILMNGFSKKGLEISNLAIENKVLRRLRKKYRPIMEDYKNNPIFNSAGKSRKIWICWLQGIDDAPLIVKRCYKSIAENFKDYEIILLSEDNYRSWVSFPTNIQEKIDKGIITKTHFSDLLRIELLTKYGGTWIDATVYCSGRNNQDYFLDDDLFMFQSLKPSLGGRPTRISSWFMTANKNSNILNLTKELLYAYWEKENKMVSYFLLHDFIELAIEQYPEEWEQVSKYSNGHPHILQYSLKNEWNEDQWNRIISLISIHKLTYKGFSEASIIPGTVLDYLLNAEV